MVKRSALPRLPYMEDEKLMVDTLEQLALTSTVLELTGKS